MNQQNINTDISALPPEAQRQIIDFIDFLKTRYIKCRPCKKTTRSKITSEPFIGIWEGRADMGDSSKWVRDARGSEWGGAS